jgi:hypothetical protein
LQGRHLFGELLFFSFAFAVQVEAAFRNYIHRSIHRAHKETHAPAPAPADAAKAPVAAGVSNDSTLAVKVDSLTDEEKGNYSDVFVCHGKDVSCMLAILLYQRVSP